MQYSEQHRQIALENRIWPRPVWQQPRTSSKWHGYTSVVLDVVQCSNALDIWAVYLVVEAHMLPTMPIEHNTAIIAQTRTLWQSASSTDVYVKRGMNIKKIETHILQIENRRQRESERETFIVNEYFAEFCPSDEAKNNFEKRLIQ